MLVFFFFALKVYGLGGERMHTTKHTSYNQELLLTDNRGAREF